PKVSYGVEASTKYGHDADFVPSSASDFLPTDAPPGSDSKIDELRRRVEEGLPLWHDKDRIDYTGLTGAVRPRE
ncbi:MAG: hypothetical protein AAGF97_00270, partial [Planctomycetota bacterium]